MKIIFDTLNCPAFHRTLKVYVHDARSQYNSTFHISSLIYIFISSVTTWFNFLPFPLPWLPFSSLQFIQLYLISISITLLTQCVSIELLGLGPSLWMLCTLHLDAFLPPWLRLSLWIVCLLLVQLLHCLGRLPRMLRNNQLTSPLKGERERERESERVCVWVWGV